MHFILLILFILLFGIFAVFSLFRRIASALFGGNINRRANDSFYSNTNNDEYDEYNNYKKNSSDSDKKIFSQNEGEYVSYEEIKE